MIEVSGAVFEPYTFEKGATERVGLFVHKYKNKDYITLRIFYEDSEGKYRPSKKGLCLSTILIPDLLAGLHDQVEQVIDKGLLEREAIEAKEAERLEAKKGVQEGEEKKGE